MSIAGLSSYNNNAALWGMDFQNLNESNSKTKSSSTSTNGNANTSKASNAASAYSYGASVSGLGAALSGAMDELGLSANDRITFQTLMSYRNKKQDDFTAQVKSDLKKLGVDEDVNFRLVSGDNGSGVKVISDDPEAQAAIEKYFKDNPKMVTNFEQIQSLNKMDDTRKKEQIDVQAIRSRIQLESMTTWYASDTNSFMAFSQQGAAYYSGVNAIA